MWLYAITWAFWGVLQYLLIKSGKNKRNWSMYVSVCVRMFEWTVLSVSIMRIKNFLRKIHFSPENHEKRARKMWHLAPSWWARGDYSAAKLSYHFKFSEDVKECLKNTCTLLDLQNCRHIKNVESLNKPCRISIRCVTLSPELFFFLPVETPSFRDLKMT